MLRCLNKLHHVILDVLAASWRENNIFGFFGVQQANWEQTKYNINIYIIVFMWCNKSRNKIFFKKKNFTIYCWRGLLWLVHNKNDVLWGFWPLVNPGLTRGILVILAKKGTVGVSVFEQVAPRHYGCSRGLMERK